MKPGCFVHLRGGKRLGPYESQDQATFDVVNSGHGRYEDIVGYEIYIVLGKTRKSRGRSKSKEADVYSSHAKVYEEFKHTNEKTVKFTDGDMKDKVAYEVDIYRDGRSYMVSMKVEGTDEVVVVSILAFASCKPIEYVQHEYW